MRAELRIAILELDLDMTKPTISPGLRFLLSAACLVVVVAGLRGARTIMVPLALALFVAVVSLPMLNFLRRRRVPSSIAILFVVLFDATAIFLFGWLVSLAALEIRNQLPIYLYSIRVAEVNFMNWLASYGVEVRASPIADLVQPERLLDIISVVFLEATDLLTGIFLVTLIFVFMLAEATAFTRKLRHIAGGDVLDFSRASTVVREIQHYLAIKTVISAVTGLSIGILTWWIGVDFPLLWGLLAFLLNYIPNVGSIIAAIPAVVVALLQSGPGVALAVAVVYLAVNALFGNLIEPLLVGYQLGMSTLVVILSLVFWGWVWGPAGMFLSVPLSMALKIGLEHSEEFRWVAYLMATEKSTPPGPDAPAATTPLAREQRAV